MCSVLSRCQSQRDWGGCEVLHSLLPSCVGLTEPSLESYTLSLLPPTVVPRPWVSHSRGAELQEGGTEEIGRLQREQGHALSGVFPRSCQGGGTHHQSAETHRVSPAPSPGFEFTHLESSHPSLCSWSSCLSWAVPPSLCFCVYYSVQLSVEN